MDQYGSHIILDLHNCDAEKLDDARYIQEVLEQAALAANATIVRSFFHRYAPQGVTGVCLVSESHLSIHTWPEYNFAAVDIFMCGREGDPEKAREFIRNAFDGKEGKVLVITRGDEPGT